MTQTIIIPTCTWRLCCDVKKNEITWHATNPNQLIIASNSEDKLIVFIEWKELD